MTVAEASAPPPARRRVARAVDVGFAAIAGALATSIAWAGCHDTSQAYDVWYYHLPFAGRLAGLTSAESYAFAADNVARYQGFPLLGEILQGIVWRLTGRVEATNLVAVASLFALPLFLRRLFGVPLAPALLAFLAIPLVQIHATSSYVDLPANACATMLLLSLYRAGLAEGPPSPRFLAGAGALAAATVNMKFQLAPIAALTAGGIAWLALARRAPGLRARVAVIVIALPIVFATPIKNAALYGNPVWPVELKLGGKSLPHREAAYESTPRHLIHVPRPVRFVRSVLEIDNRPIASKRRWSLDQWTPWEETGYRMGGFFGAYVVVNLLALGWRAFRGATREAMAAAFLVAGVTIEAAFVPQSHELRYYLHWMLLLVALNLVLWTRATRERVAASGVALAALGVVAWSTDGGYLYASGKTFAELSAEKVDRALIESAAPGARLCIARPPWTFLYAPRFHPGKDYTVEEAATEADCAAKP